MKPVEKSKFRLPLRRIAEALWGTGGTSSCKTNRKYVGYYSCSSHGGYVVDSKALTDKEKAQIEQYVKPTRLPLYVQYRRDGDYVFGIGLRSIQRYGNGKASFRYDPSLGPAEIVDYPIYTFEEDCEWVVLEKFTDIRAGITNLSEEERQKHIENAMKMYFYKTKV